MYKETQENCITPGKCLSFFHKYHLQVKTKERCWGNRLWEAATKSPGNMSCYVDLTSCLSPLLKFLDLNLSQDSSQVPGDSLTNGDCLINVNVSYKRGTSTLFSELLLHLQLLKIGTFWSGIFFYPSILQQFNLEKEIILK